MPITSKRIEIVALIVLILLVVFFRFWQIRNYMVFLGDEGRDMIVLRKIFTEGNIPFLGPTASVGGFYLGPIYYWMAAPFLLLWRFDPVGPSYMVAILGVATVFILYKFLRETTSFWPAIFASSLYATAPLIVRYSRSSWNPNPLPFFALLLIYFLYLGIVRNKFILGPQLARTASYAYYLLAGSAFGISVQLHYLASILAAIAALIVVLNTNFKKWPLIFLFSLAGFLITFSPFLIFEARHNFPNFHTILEFVSRGSTVGYKTTHLVWLISNGGNIFLEFLTKLHGTIATSFIFWFLTLGGLFGLFTYRKDREKKVAFSIALVWFIGSLAGIRFYAGQILDHYFGFMFPAPFLLIGLVFYLLWQKLAGKLLVITIVASALTLFILNGFYRHPPNRLIAQTESVADFVIEKSDGQPFNFGLISDHNSDHAYRYFLEIKDRTPTDLETLVTDQLLVVCESKKCAPLGHPIWEIAGFGRAEIAGEWELPNIGIKVFRLIHWPGAPSPAGKPAIKGG